MTAAARGLAVLPSGHAGRVTLPMALCFAMAVATSANLPLMAADGVGFREIGGTNVASGAVTIDGSLKLSPEATYMKTGAGTLEIPSASIDSAAPYRIDVVGGTLRLTGDAADSSAAVVPAVAQQAALWVDVNDLSVGDISEWTDTRGNGKWKAVAKSATGSSLAEDTTVEVVVTNGVKCVDFGGKSSKYMRFYAGASALQIDDVHHFFVVHGVVSCWGALLGHWSTPGTAGYTYADTYGMAVDSAPKAEDLLTAHFYKGAEYGTAMYQTRFFLDGRRIDPYTKPPRRGFQLLEGDMLAKPLRLETFFYNRGTLSGAKAGGDFICEALLFTNRLSEVQRLDVERYLMKKWNLPTATLTAKNGQPKSQLPIHRGTGRVRIAEGASAEVSVAAGETSAAFAFEGAGNATKTGEGMMVVGSGAERPFTGDFTLEAGSLLMHGGAMPPVTAASGETYDASRWPTTRTTAAVDVTSGVRVVRSTGGTVGTFRKTGVGAISVKGIAADTTRIQVEGGMLRLAGLETNLLYDACDTGVAAIEVPIPNHSFEAVVDEFDSNGISPVTLNSSSNGWYHLNGGALAFINSVKCKGTWAGYYPPDGKQALLMRGQAYAETDVTIPRAGTYEVSFFAGSRYGINTSAADPANDIRYIPVMDIKFAGEAVGRMHVSKNGFVRYRYRFTVAAANVGEAKRLRFQCLRAYAEDTIVLDDVRIRAVAYAGQTESVALPNGDFEKSDKVGATAATYQKSPYFNRDEVAEGWTFSLLDESAGTALVNGFVGIMNGGMEVCYTNKNGKQLNIPAYPYADGRCGTSVLGFIGSKGRAEMTEGTTVSLAPGKWRLRGRAAMLQAASLEVPFGRGAYSDFRGTPSLSASVIRAGGEEPLGSVSPATRMMDVMMWPGEIEVAETENVRVALVQTASNGGCVVDDLEFVPVTSGEPEANIFPDYGCEKGSLWTDYTYPSTDFGYSVASIARYNTTDDTSYAWGCDCFEGDFALRCRGRGGKKISVTFPVKGLYRLTFHARARADGANLSCLPLRGFVKLSDDSEMEIFRMQMPFIQGFQEYTYLFEMPETGVKTFCIHGIAMDDVNTGDRSSYVDGISIVKVDDLAQSVPEVPKTARISVAGGARLALDYAGTVKVESLTLGGVKIRGSVSAATHPDFITGMGEIEVLPSGFLLSIR